MEQIRCFIAIELPSQIKEALVLLEEKLKAGQHLFVKWVDPEGIHLTLKFLGSVDSKLIPRITEAIERAAQGISPFSLHLGGLGAFPSFERPQVVWIGVGGEVEKLALLQKGIQSALAPLGFPSETRDFTPHLTLGRLREKVSPSERREFGGWVKAAKFETRLNFEASQISLMKSQLTPKGAIYSCLASVKLGTFPNMTEK